MTRFLVAAPVATVLVLLAGSPAGAAEQVPGLGQCFRVQETHSQLGFEVCTPPIG